MCICFVFYLPILVLVLALLVLTTRLVNLLLFGYDARYSMHVGARVQYASAFA